MIEKLIEFKIFCEEYGIKFEGEFYSDRGMESASLYGGEIVMCEELKLDPEKEYSVHSFYLDENEELLGSIIEDNERTILLVIDTDVIMLNKPLNKTLAVKIV